MSGHEVILALLAAALVMAGRELQLIRMRDALNRSLHEIRRPLQALALDGPRPSVAQAIRAVGDLDHQLNGGARPVSRPELIACRLMVDACVRRWRSRAHLAGAEIELRWVGPDALVRGDGIVLAGAIENLIVNAIEHGGPEIRIDAKTVGRWVRIEITDSGRSSRPASRKDSPAEVMAQQRGRRHGHGLEVAERAILEHGGRFEPEIDDAGSTVTVALPRSRPRQHAPGGLRVNW